MNRNTPLDDHQKFKELAAWGQRGKLSLSERLELERHLEICDSCRQAQEEYSLISGEGMNFLAATYGFGEQIGDWDQGPAREKLFARIRETERRTDGIVPRLFHMGRSSSLLSLRTPLVRSGSPWAAAVAACVLVAVAAGAYKMGGRARIAPVLVASSANAQNIAFHKNTSDELMAAQRFQLSKLENELSSSSHEVARLRDALRSAEAGAAALQAHSKAADEQFRRVSEERDKLAGELRDAELSYQLVQEELTNLRAERDRELLHTASLQSKIDELKASSADQDHRLKDDEAYLASDRDIRELMGARKLYIADVFDVDSGSRTRKPFGRVFYTESKSLIFYAFDLDRQPGVKNASAFQVWGQRDAESGEKNRAMNLGILYMDSESNRRWVLRLDDPKQLAEIDAVFVTVEPQGGSQKPTGKPFLYALLRREANHP